MQRSIKKYTLYLQLQTTKAFYDFFTICFRWTRLLCSPLKPFWPDKLLLFELSLFLLFSERYVTIFRCVSMSLWFLDSSYLITFHPTDGGWRISVVWHLTGFSFFFLNRFISVSSLSLNLLYFTTCSIINADINKIMVRYKNWTIKKFKARF